MSATQPTPVATPPTIVEKLELFGHAALTAVDHAAMRLVAMCATSTQNLMTLEASHPSVKLAWDEGVAAAKAYGVPVDAIENVFSAVLAAAKAFAAPPVLPPAPSPVGC